MVNSIPELVRALLGRLSETGIGEAEFREGDLRVRVRRRMLTPAARKPRAAARPFARPAMAAAIDARLQAVLSPIAGVFFRAPSPGEPPYLELGDEVQNGQVVGMVEAMKVFNEVVSQVAGTVVDFVAADGADVREGSPILRVRAHTERRPTGADSGMQEALDAI